MIEIAHVAGDRFAIRVRGHELVSDQPVGAGGEDAGPTPTELFVAGLASCAAFYAGRFLRRHVPAEVPFSVSCSYDVSVERPARVTDVRIALDMPTPLRADLREALLRAAEHCTVHNSLRTPPEVRISLRDGLSVAAAR